MCGGVCKRRKIGVGKKFFSEVHEKFTKFHPPTTPTEMTQSELLFAMLLRWWGLMFVRAAFVVEVVVVVVVVAFGRMTPLLALLSK